MSSNVNESLSKKNRSLIEVWKIKQRWWLRRFKKTSSVKKRNTFLLVFIIIFGLVLEIDREAGHIKDYPNLPPKSFHCYSSNYCTAEGSWDNAHYPNTSQIVCDRAKGQCIIKTVDILFNLLENTEEDFDIHSWDKNLITADCRVEAYLIRLTLNLTTEDVTYTKYPIKKEVMPGWETEESSFKLIDGYEWKIQMQDKDWKETKAWKVPILKILFSFLKPNEEQEKS